MEDINKILESYDKQIQLDENQMRVLLSNKKNIMVIAGAGSGKTTTIAGKVKYLVDFEKINPKEILIISLTNKAIQELQTIINERLRIDAKICTFHKIAYEILKINDSRYKLVADKAEIIRELIKENKSTKKVTKFILKDKILKNKLKYEIKNQDVLADLLINNINLIKTMNIKVIPEYNIYFKYLKEIYDSYAERMRKNHLVDFDDLINESIESKIKLKYKYVIVDEYQDISQNRLDLLKNIVKATKAKLMVVGDDFQTIFSFAGATLRQFKDFLNMRDAEIIKIVQTYRNSQQIIDVAGSFVMKDTELIKKNLKSKKELEKPVKIYGYKNNFSEVFEKILNEIIEEYGLEKKILVLGRYKTDINKLDSDDFIIKNDKIIYKKYKELKMDFLTIHSSKGLGYDNVILINMEKGNMGFPSMIQNDKFTEKIVGYKVNVLEERRLMYVAITRTKNKFYAITKIKNESEYVKELAKYENVVIDYKIK